MRRSDSTSKILLRAHEATWRSSGSCLLTGVHTYDGSDYYTKVTSKDEAATSKNDRRPATTTSTTRRCIINYFDYLSRLENSSRTDFAPLNTSRNQLRLVNFNQAKSLIPFSTCFSQDRLLFLGTPLDRRYARGLHHDRLLCVQPTLFPTILSATCTLIECFMRAAHLICRHANFFFRCLLSMVTKVLEETMP